MRVQILLNGKVFTKSLFTDAENAKEFLEINGLDPRKFEVICLRNTNPRRELASTT